ncbi:MAG: nucleotidyltransferase family protein [Verrucomicrobiales bacterium]|nr:nucleotidyltransferase family protein [Verrucomicrobiales bacterium]
MQPSFQLLIAALQAGIQPKSKQRLTSAIRQASEKDWQKFIKHCSHHKVSNLARSSIHQNELWDLLPEHVRISLDAHYHNSVAWSLKLDHVLQRITAAFNNADIPIIPWKGPMLSQCLFDNIWSREYVDLDFLVPPHYQTQAEHLLATLDYHLDHEEIAANPASLANNNDHCLAYRHPKLGVWIEIHHTPLPSAFRFKRSIDEILVTSTLIEPSTHFLRRLSLEDEFLLLVAHGAKHHWCQLNWSYDLAVFMHRYQNQIDWKKTRSLAEQLGCLRMIKTAIALCEKIWMIPISAPHIDSPNTDTTACRLATAYIDQLQAPSQPNSSKTRLLWKYHSFYHALLTRERYRDRLPVIGATLAYMITPNPSERSFYPSRFPLNLCPGLFRPLRLLLKYGLHIGK